MKVWKKVKNKSMQLNFKNDITQPVIFNTPKSLNLSELFPTYTQDKLNKVVYIIHQCNYYSNKQGYNLDLSNHRWFLSLTRNDIISIKNVLVEASVIKQTIKGGKGKRSDHYSMVKPFNYLNESTVDKHFFYLNTPECPLWVQRYVADDSSCRNAKTTNWVKRGDDWQPLTEQPVTVNKSDKDYYIKLLEDALKANGIALPVIKSAPVTVETVPVNSSDKPKVIEMAVAEIKPPVATVVVIPEVPPAAAKPEVSQANKATQLLQELKVKAKSKQLSTALITDYYLFENFSMANHSRYKRATQLVDTLNRIMLERKLIQLVDEGYVGVECYQIEEQVFNFFVESTSKKVLFESVKDAEIAA